jgi:starch phosphorylase
MVLLEDYDMNLARYLVSGVDVWLNNPLPPYEASGTSGMKVPANGGINLSVLDGWWPEAFDGENGWAIGDGTTYPDRDYQDWLESQGLYELLEKELVPLFYERGPDGLPRRWIARMKHSMKTICPVFNTNRMVSDYTRKFYVPTALHFARITANDFEAARRLAAWRTDIAAKWHDVAIEHVDADGQDEIRVGAELHVKATIRLGAIPCQNVHVEIYHGPRSVAGELSEAHVEPMTCTEQLANGQYVFTGAMRCEVSGQHGFAVRVRPHHDDERGGFETGLIVWG